MKITIIVLCVLCTVAALADQPKPTADELQKKVDFLTAVVQDVTQQRDQYRSQLDNIQAAADATAKTAPKDPPCKK